MSMFLGSFIFKGFSITGTPENFQVPLVGRVCFTPPWSCPLVELRRNVPGLTRCLSGLWKGTGSLMFKPQLPHFNSSLLGQAMCPFTYLFVATDWVAGETRSKTRCLELCCGLWVGKVPSIYPLNCPFDIWAQPPKYTKTKCLPFNGGSLSHCSLPHSSEHVFAAISPSLLAAAGGYTHCLVGYQFTVNTQRIKHLEGKWSKRETDMKTKEDRGCS